MSLDKWIKSEEEKDEEGKAEAEKKSKTKKKKSSTKNKPKSKTLLQESEALITPENAIKKFTKYTLVCPKKSCGYQKTILKKQLIEKDKICPRCKSEMKIKKI